MGTWPLAMLRYAHARHTYTIWRINETKSREGCSYGQHCVQMVQLSYKRYIRLFLVSFLNPYDAIKYLERAAIDALRFPFTVLCGNSPPLQPNLSKFRLVKYLYVYTKIDVVSRYIWSCNIFLESECSSSIINLFAGCGNPRVIHVNRPWTVAAPWTLT